MASGKPGAVQHLHQCKPEQLRVRLRKLARSPVFECFIAKYYQSTLLNTATTALSNATGVNIDNEMSKMLDLENSYSATAKLISTIDSMFGTLITNLENLPA